MRIGWWGDPLLGGGMVWGLLWGHGRALGGAHPECFCVVQLVRGSAGHGGSSCWPPAARSEMARGGEPVMELVGRRRSVHERIAAWGW